MHGPDSHSRSRPWVSDPTAALRPYAMVGGRTRPSHEMDLTYLVKARTGAAGHAAAPEYAQVLALCRTEPRSVAEIAATIRQPVQVTKILISDLLDRRAVIPAMPTRMADPRDIRVLEAVIAGLRKL